MSFQPIVPLTGFAGWAFLNRTRETQQQTFNNSAQMTRETEHFREKIASIRSAEELVGDRTLLKVALGAFGLEDDINNKFFIQKVLSDGILDSQALANKLSDKRYRAFAAKFDFGDNIITNLEKEGFADEIIAAYSTKQFEVAVGEQSSELRLAMGFERELDAVLDRDLSDNGAWFAVMGTPPVRKVFETALGLPSSIGSLDVDQQLEVFRDRSDALFGEGEVSAYKDPEKREELLRLFLVRSEIESYTQATTGGNVALSLISQIPRQSLFG